MLLCKSSSSYCCECPSVLRANFYKCKSGLSVALLLNLVVPKFLGESVWFKMLLLKKDDSSTGFREVLDWFLVNSFAYCGVLFNVVLSIFIFKFLHSWNNNDFQIVGFLQGESEWVSDCCSSLRKTWRGLYHLYRDALASLGQLTETPPAFHSSSRGKHI